MKILILLSFKKKVNANPFFLYLFLFLHTGTELLSFSLVPRLTQQLLTCGKKNMEIGSWFAEHSLACKIDDLKHHFCSYIGVESILLEEMLVIIGCP